MNYKISLSDLVISLVKDKTALLKQNNEKDLIIEQLKAKLNMYEGSNA